jgi:hypothetical protein
MDPVQSDLAPQLDVTQKKKTARDLARAAFLLSGELLNLA